MKENYEKFFIGVPAETYYSLRRDAEQFEIYKEDSREINMNRFLTLLFVGYRNDYKQERIDKAEKIRNILDRWIPAEKRREEIVKKIMDEVVLPDVPKRKGEKIRRLPYKPTQKTKRFIDEIKDKKIPCAQYLSGLLVSYCNKPIHERERIIFSEEADLLENACKTRSEIVFATFQNPGIIHHVIPYDLVTGAEEMNNYLLGQEFNEKHGRFEPVSYRLCRINKPDYSESTGILEKDIIRYLEMMKKQGPQYAITEDSEICVKLTPAGQKSYQQIYFGRPSLDRDRIKMLDDGCALYYFDASPEQVFRFVVRFRAGEAEIISPPELREKIVRHYRQAIIPYNKE